MDPIEINPSSSHLPTHSVIFLHGLGADGHDFTSLVPELNHSSSLSLRFVFPSAPFRPITINQGYAMRAWYDIYSMQIDARVDLDSIHESIELINALIANENKKGIPSNKI